LAVGCSHGVYADQRAVSAVLKFREAFKPDVCIHLGDAFDVTALRSGAKGTPDEGAPIAPDIDGGILFLSLLKPTLFLWGNHEDRIDRLVYHHNAIVSALAGELKNALDKTCTDIGAEVVPYRGIYQGREFGGFRYMHGAMFGENAVRDHAETFGNVVFAHTHRAGMAVGRRSDSPRGFCVGTLTRMANLDYAKTRRSTLGWSQGFVWGYFKGTTSQLWLHEHQGAGEWLLPG
jgi:hypothetical protein